MQSARALMRLNIELSRTARKICFSVLLADVRVAAAPGPPGSRRRAPTGVAIRQGA